ncbi:MAG: hypothetical protein JST14_00265 [Bacteroidetes bacterium]|nr:hypothetical protein [Bacteroidota bacterium]
MIRNFIFVFVLMAVFSISCTNDTITPKPPSPSTTSYVYIDDSEVLLQNMKKKLIGTWNVILTQTDYPYRSPTDSLLMTFPIRGEVDCAKENQWDYLKSITISELTPVPDKYLLNVVNHYYCRPDRKTNFMLRIQKPDNIFSIKEFNCCLYSNSKEIKSYELIPTTTDTEMILTTIAFDPSYFHLENVGSIKFPPKRYMIIIEKK